MIQQVKQCAGCGAQMGARGRVCPRCGRGSLFGELLWIAVLGVLLLGIGVMSGLVPLDRPGLARLAPAATDGGTKPTAATPAARGAANRRQARKATKDAKPGPAESSLAYAPCRGADTEATRQQPSESSHGGPHTPAPAPCREVDDSSGHPSVQPPPAAPAP